MIADRSRSNFLNLIFYVCIKSRNNYEKIVVKKLQILKMYLWNTRITLKIINKYTSASIYDFFITLYIYFMCFIIVLLEKNGFLIGWKISIHVIGPLGSRILSTVTVVSIDKIFITPSRADKFYRKRKEYKNRIGSHAYISSWTYQPKRYRLFLVSNKYWDINWLTLDIFCFYFKIIICT